MCFQGTNVTLVPLSVDKGYLECLASGDLKKKGGVVAYSRRCNILSNEGRMYVFGSVSVGYVNNIKIS